MEAKRSQFVLKLLPSFADFAFLMPIVFLFGALGGSRSLLADCDTGWHIRTGEWILLHRAVPRIDPFSYSKAGQPWFAWEWLSDVVMARLNALDGLRALLLLSIVLICASFTVLYHLSKRRSNSLAAIAVTMLAAVASSVHWLARPHLFTLLFVAIFYWGLDRIRENPSSSRRWFLVFPAITLFWTQLHGGFFVGILMISAYAGGEFLHYLLREDAGGRREAWIRARGYFLCAVACAGVSLINPYGWRLHTHMARYLTNPWNSEHIAEFLSPSFHDARVLFFEVLLVLGGAAAVWCLARRRYAEAILIGIWAHAALLAGRNIEIYVMVAAPIVAEAAASAAGAATRANVAVWARGLAARFQRLAAGTDEKEAVGRWHLASAAGFLLVVATLFAPNPPESFRAEFNPHRYPQAALAALQPDASSRIFTHDEWGDYLIWTLYPKGRVFVDGRSDFYGNDFEDKYDDVIGVRPNWEKILADFSVDTVLMPPRAPLTGALKESSRWRVVYDDGIALVFRSVDRSSGPTNSAASRGGTGRDREVTKTATRGDLRITAFKSKS